MRTSVRLTFFYPTFTILGQDFLLCLCSDAFSQGKNALDGDSERGKRAPQQGQP